MDFAAGSEAPPALMTSVMVRVPEVNGVPGTGGIAEPAGPLALAALASARLDGGGVAAGPGFVVSTLANPVFKGANTEPSLRLARDGTAYVGAIRGFPKGVDLWRVGAGGGPAAYLGSPD